jgi:hypothetical protein
VSRLLRRAPDRLSIPHRHPSLPRLPIRRPHAAQPHAHTQAGVHRAQFSVRRTREECCIERSLLRGSQSHPCAAWFNSNGQHRPHRRPRRGCLRHRQPRACSLGGHQAGPPHLLGTPKPPFSHAEVSSPLEGNPPANSSTAVDRRAIFGHASPTDGTTTPASSKQPPTTGSGNVAATHGCKEASRPHSPVSSTFQHPSSFFRQPGNHRDHTRAARPRPITITPRLSTSHATTRPTTSSRTG